MQIPPTPKPEIKLHKELTPLSEGRYRIFVSYSHDDQPEFETLKATLESCGICVLSDRNIGAGTPFTDAIKGLITHAHLFMPLITNNARSKPWVHQETGFVMARNIPILPIVLKDAGMPSEMIAQLQAIELEEVSKLKEYFQHTSLEDLIFPRPAPPVEMVQIAEWPEQRTEWLGTWANRVRNLGYAGLFRQRGALSSFCIPDKDITDETWKKREGDQKRSDYYRHLQREERRALEWHATKTGCRLIIDPSLRFKDRSLGRTVARLETLLSFLEAAIDFRVEVVLSPQAREGSLTIVGDWFVAESMVPRPGGYLQTIFNWHAPTVSRWVRRFDEQFMDLCRQQELNPAESRELAIKSIRQTLGKYREEMSRTSPPTTEPTPTERSVPGPNSNEGLHPNEPGL